MSRLFRYIGFLIFCHLMVSVSAIGQPIAETSGSRAAALEQIYDEAGAIGSVRSIHIEQNGELIGKHYFGDASPEWPVNIKSASKSVISLLVGIAIDNELIPSVNQPIRPYFESYFEQHPDSVKESITIKNLLTMQAGLETTSFGNYGRWVISDNWVEFILDQPIVKAPGSEMIYSTGSSHLLSVILTKATGMSTKTFAEQYLFDPLHIQVGGWEKDPQGYYMGGNNLALKARDLLKIGEMVLHKGVYRGERIISENWLEESFQAYGRSNFNPYDYGYAWWIKPVNGVQMHFAWGYGGQYLFMFPELDSIVVLTSSLQHATQAREYKAPVFKLLRSELIPFLQEVAGVSQEGHTN
jgi:CubicO group peptidase (beta-lactamase class C family)